MNETPLPSRSTSSSPEGSPLPSRSPSPEASTANSWLHKIHDILFNRSSKSTSSSPEVSPLPSRSPSPEASPLPSRSPSPEASPLPSRSSSPNPTKSILELFNDTVYNRDRNFRMQEVPFPHELDSIKETRIYLTRVNNVDYIAPYSEMQLRKMNSTHLSFDLVIETLAQTAENPESARVLLIKDLSSIIKSTDFNFKHLTYNDVVRLFEKSEKHWYTAWLDCWSAFAKPEFRTSKN